MGVNRFDRKLAETCAKYLLFMQDKTGKTMPLCKDTIVRRWDIEGIQFTLFKDLSQDAVPNYILAFPGLNEQSDIQYLVDYRYRKRSEGGVFSSLRSVFSRIVGALNHQESFCIGDDVTITGYSMGAVLAVFTAYYWGKSIIDNVYLFGAPRPGDENFSNSYDDHLYDRTYRISMPGDFVTHTPVNGWHVGQPIVLKPDSIEFGAKHWTDLVDRNWFDNPKLFWLTPMVLTLWWTMVTIGVLENAHDLQEYHNSLKGESA